MKKLSFLVTLSTAVCLLLASPLTAIAASAELVKPTFLPYVSGIENPSYSLTANLDDATPTLNTSLFVHADTNKEIQLTLPVYGRFCDVDRTDISLTMSGEENTPSLSYSTDTFGFPSTFSHEEVLAMKLSSELPDMATPCYYYSFSTESKGTVTFTLPENVTTFTRLTSYSYHSQNRQYTVNLRAANEQTILLIGKDLTLLDTADVSVEKTVMTCSDFLNDIMEVISVIGQETNIDTERTKGIIYARFAHYVASSEIDVNITDLIDAPFDYGFTYFDYTITLPQGESTINLTQPFLYSTDTAYKPEVQNFHITAPTNSNVSVLLDTDRYILDGESSFEKTDKNYTFNGTVSNHIAINVCASNASTPLYPSNTSTQFPTWTIVVLSICGTGFIICIVLLIYFSVSKRHK